MLFNSEAFLWFFVAVLAAYYAAVRSYRWQNRLLLVASYLFYGWLDWRFGGLLLTTTLVNWSLGRKLGTTQDPRSRSRWLLVGLAWNLGVLGFFKYCGFFVASASSVLAWFGLSSSWTFENLVLPLGISFYTFQAIGYLVDVHRRLAEPVRSLEEFALFLAFFPQLLMGPIERTRQLLPQIRGPRIATREGFLRGGWLVFYGLYKKVFVADQLGRLCDPIFAGPAPYAGGDVALAGFLFTLQIYADFSGYTDIARGCARMLGFELATNFRAPYFARNVQDFWNRWHISLSTWIRDYVFYPMAVSTHFARLRAGGIAIVTMTLMGLWHGADWTFVIWGTVHGVLLAVYGRGRAFLRRRTTFDSRIARAAFAALSIAATFACVATLEVLFRTGYGTHATLAPLEHATAMYSGLLRDPFGATASWATLVVGLKIAAVMLALDACDAARDEEDPLLGWPTAARRLVQGFMLYSVVHALAVSDTQLGETFQYFRF